MINTPIKTLKSLIKKQYLKTYYMLPKEDVTYAQDLLYTFHNTGFMKEPLFIKSYDLGKKTAEGWLDYDIQWRVHTICWAAYHASHLEGDFVECGVNTGIYARSVVQYIRFQKLKKRFWLLDTFSGMDPRYSSPEEMKKSEEHKYNKRDWTYEQVKKTFAKFTNVKIIKGAVPDTLPQVKTDKICFLSIDMNSVKPEVAALEFFWDKMVSGGLIILDDYAYRHCENQKKAHDIFAKSKNVKVLTLPTCQGLIIKP